MSRCNAKVFSICSTKQRVDILGHCLLSFENRFACQRRRSRYCFLNNHRSLDDIGIGRFQRSIFDCTEIRHFRSYRRNRGDRICFLDARTAAIQMSIDIRLDWANPMLIADRGIRQIHRWFRNEQSLQFIDRWSGKNRCGVLVEIIEIILLFLLIVDIKYTLTAAEQRAIRRVSCLWFNQRSRWWRANWLGRCRRNYVRLWT